MNWNHYSKLLIGLLLVSAAAGLASAVTVDGTAPTDAEVGTNVEELTFEVTEPFQPRADWTLRGTTELANASWTVEEIDTAGDVVERTRYPQADDPTPETFEHELSQGNDVTLVRVTLSGDVPPIENHSYDPAERLIVAEFEQLTPNNVEPLATFETHPYTADSRAARNAIEDAQAAIDEVGGHEDAEADLADAIRFYNNGQFDSAIENAERAERKATNAQQQSELVELALLGLGVVVVLAIIIGGIYWRRSNRTGSKL